MLIYVPGGEVGSSSGSGGDGGDGGVAALEVPDQILGLEPWMKLVAMEVDDDDVECVKLVKAVFGCISLLWVFLYVVAGGRKYGILGGE